jgi:predicted protein tyrosine phosphatase
MNIKILSRKLFADVIRNEPNQHDAVIIHELDQQTIKWIDRLKPLCRSYICLDFEDVVGLDPTGPTIDHVTKALDWATEKDEIIVTCQAGISRSSAIAYLIGCLKDTPEKAAELFEDHHYPNELVIQHGITIFGEKITPPVLEFYKKRALSFTKLWEKQRESKRTN